MSEVLWCNFAVLDDPDPLLAEIHACILKDDPRELAQLCQEDVDLDEKFGPGINNDHVGMTPLALACALNKVQLAEVGDSKLLKS